MGYQIFRELSIVRVFTITSALGELQMGSLPDVVRVSQKDTNVTGKLLGKREAKRGGHYA